MNLRKIIWLTAIALMAVTLSACGGGTAAEPTQDISAIQTQAMQLVQTQAALQQTQTAMAVPPSPLPTSTLPTLASAVATQPTFGSVLTTPFTTPGTGTPFAFNTPATGFTAIASPLPTSGDTCHKLDFVADLTIPDGTVFRPGETFVKAWRVMNSGTCAWDDGYILTYLGGTLGGKNIPVAQITADFVQPGETWDPEIPLNASCTAQRYEECWRMKDDGGYFFGTPICVVIEVKGDPVGGCD